MDLDAARLAVAGTLLGAAIGVVGAWLNTRQQLRHQERTRWHAEQRSLVSQLIRHFDAADQLMVGSNDVSRLFDLLGQFEDTMVEAELVVPEVLMSRARSFYGAFSAECRAYAKGIEQDESPWPPEVGDRFDEARRVAMDWRRLVREGAREHFGLKR